MLRVSHHPPPPAMVTHPRAKMRCARYARMCVLAMPKTGPLEPGIEGPVAGAIACVLASKRPYRNTGVFVCARPRTPYRASTRTKCKAAPPVDGGGAAHCDRMRAHRRAHSEHSRAQGPETVRLISPSAWWIWCDFFLQCGGRMAICPCARPGAHNYANNANGENHAPLPPHARIGQCEDRPDPGQYIQR